MTTEQTLMAALVPYDLFPYVLVTEGYPLPNGDFKSTTYNGVYHKHNVVSVFHHQYGLLLKDQIEQLQYMKRQEEKQLDAKYLKSLAAIDPSIERYVQNKR